MRREAIDHAPGSACAPSPADGERGPARTRGRRAGIPMPSRGLTGLVVLGMFGLAVHLSEELAPAPTRMRLVPGEPGTLTLGFALSPDGATIATTSNDGRLSLRDVRDVRVAERVLDHRRGLALGLAFSPDGRSLALGREGSGIRIFDLARGGSRLRLDLPISRTRNLVFSPDGGILAATTENPGEIVLWDLDAARTRTKLYGRFAALSLAFSPDGRCLAVGGKDEMTVTVWDLETGRSRTIWRESAGPITSVAFAPDGGLLAAASPCARTRPALGPGVGSIAAPGRGACRRHHLGEFLPDGRPAGHLGQRRDGPHLECSHWRTAHQPGWPGLLDAAGRLLGRWPDARRRRKRQPHPRLGHERDRRGQTRWA